MSLNAIDSQALGKRYRLGAPGEQYRYRALRDVIVDLARAPLDRLRGRGPARNEERHLWALKDASFTIPHGQAVGFIGRNGAGKSTLLKLLSRITEPTEGRAIIHGRMASLLEVGTGFHPEMTGRENIYLAGVILGMTRPEIRRKLDEIVAFAEVQKFVDTPVKRYSSGMYVRLAFAVAAHLEPDILLVDEVLAVGDMQFQKKCLSKMQDVGSSGRTVLFVSHNMPAITRLCTRAILLQDGRIVADGAVAEIVQQYFVSAAGSSAVRTWTDEQLAPGSDGFKLHAVALVNADGTPATVARVDAPLALVVRYSTHRPELSCRMIISFNTQGVCAFPAIQRQEMAHPRPGSYEARVELPANLLAEGEYNVDVSVFASRGKKAHFCKVADAIAFQTTDPMTGDSVRGDYAEGLNGVMRPRLDWRQSPLRQGAELEGFAEVKS
jgi:lipopolysaccharide transport system ATP-binding protein